MSNTRRAAKPRVARSIEEAILQYAFERPAFGQDRVARELQAKRLFVSASGVRYVWQRHDIETLEKRVRFIEERLRRDNIAPTAEQIAARERVRATRKTHRMAATVLGDDSGRFRRSEYILAIAARLFRQQGFEATSLRDIAKHARIPVGSFYYHFPTKDELFAAVYEEAMRRVTHSVTRALEGVHDPWDRLQAACAAHLQLLCEPDDFAIAPLATRIPSVEPQIRAKLIELNDRYEDFYRKLLDELDLPPDVHRGLLRLQILGAVIWTSVWYRPGRARPAEIAANLIKALRMPLDPGPSNRRKQANRGRS